MPESTPAPNRRISRSGHDARTWFQRVILPCASGAQSVFSSATVIVVGPGVLRVHDDGEAVVGDRAARCIRRPPSCTPRFRPADRPRGVADVGLAAAELLEAAARAGDADGGRAPCRVGLAELLGDRFRDREDGARAVDRDEGRRGLAAFLGGLAGAAAARAHPKREGREHCRPNDAVSHAFTLSNGNFAIVSVVLIPRYGPGNAGQTSSHRRCERRVG